MFSLDNKTAIITGGAGILGQHFCKSLNEHGANVVIADINFEAAQNLAEEIGEKAHAVELDLTSEKSVKNLLKETLDKFGSVEILHNNAATKSKDFKKFFDKPEDFSMDIWREIEAVNLDGMFLCAREIGGHMAQNGGGSIVQTASIYGIMGADNRIYEGSEYMGTAINTPPVYAATKAGVVGLTKYLACYWGKKNVRVNTLTPGGVESGQNETFKQKYSARVPMNRMAKPQEMCGALVFLASDASSYITGQNIIVDGGLSAW